MIGYNESLGIGKSANGELNAVRRWNPLMVITRLSGSEYIDGYLVNTSRSQHFATQVKCVLWVCPGSCSLLFRLQGISLCQYSLDVWKEGSRLIRQTFTTELVQWLWIWPFRVRWSRSRQITRAFRIGQLLRIRARLFEARYDSAQRLLANQEHKISLVWYSFTQFR